MAGFLISVIQELEALQFEHARIVQRLRAEQQHVANNDRQITRQQILSWFSKQGGLEEADVVDLVAAIRSDVEDTVRPQHSSEDVGLEGLDLRGRMYQAAPLCQEKEYRLQQPEELELHLQESQEEELEEPKQELREQPKPKQRTSADWSSRPSCSSDLRSALSFQSAPRMEWTLNVELVQSSSQELTLAEAQQMRGQLQKECIDHLWSVRHQGFATKAPLRMGKKATMDSELFTPDQVSRLSSVEEVRRKLRVSRPSLSGSLSLPVSPHTTRRLAWDLLGLILVLYEAITIPILLLVLTAQDRIDGTLDFVFNIYWTLDILLTLVTRVEVEGELKGGFRIIAMRYARTWLALDALMVLPEWILFFAQDGGRAGLSVLRILKISRGLRLLRVLKMENTIRRQMGRINSSSLLNLLSLLQMMVAFIILNHFIACVWVFIGQEADDGWLKQSTSHDSSIDMLNGYMLALHWAISQFHGNTDVYPGNLSERTFAVSMQVAGLLTLSVFVSTTTNLIMQERQARRQLNERRENMRMYFLNHKVSPEIMLGIKTYLNSDLQEKEWMDDVQVLQGLPYALQKSVMLEVRSPTVERHWLFLWLRDFHPPAFRNVVQSAFSTSHHVAGNAVFEAGDALEKIIFVVDGHLRYIPGQAPTQRSTISRTSMMLKQISNLHVGTRIGNRRWLCELALWVQGWQAQGSCISLPNSSTLCLGSVILDQTLREFPSARLDVVMYVHGVLQEILSNELETNLVDDLWRPGSDLEHNVSNLTSQS